MPKSMRSIEKLQKLVDQVKKKFPVVKDKEIIIRYVNLPYDYLCSYRDNRKYIIDADSKVTPYLNKRVIIGGLAHELAHFQIDNNLRGLAKALDIERYNSSKTYYKYAERETDLEVILMGYGKPLYSFTRFREKSKRKKRISFGLTSKEIRKLVYKT